MRLGFDKFKYRLFYNCKIYKNVELLNSSLGRYCNIAHDVSIINSSINHRTSIGRYSKLRDSKVGKYCSISFDTIIGAVSHPLENISTHAFSYRKQFGIVNENKNYENKQTEIGNDVWIGCGAIILAGVKIGDGAVIGAGSVVTKDVQPYSIVAGVPAKELRKRFSKEIISELLEIKWWNCPDIILKKNIKLFSKSADLETIKELKMIKGE